MQIQVLGSGCPSCKRLHQLTQQACQELGAGLEVEYITDINELIAMGVMSSPVLAVNGQAVLAGSVPSLEKIKSVLKEAGVVASDK